MDTITTKGDNAQPGRSPIEDELLEWGDRFKALSDRAADAGFTTVVLISGYDPINREVWRNCGYTGNFHAAVGLLKLHEADLLDG